MMCDRIEHTEHRRRAEERREPVAWAGPATGTPARDGAARADGARR